MMVEYSILSGRGKIKFSSTNNSKEATATITNLLTSSNKFRFVTFCCNLLNLYGLIESASLASLTRI
jgi:hypothetical protein